MLTGDYTNGAEAQGKGLIDQNAQGKVNAGLDQMQNFTNAVQAQNGLGNQSQVYNQLQNQISGNGPSVAQNQLNQATAQNVNNQAAMANSQRGAGANAGLAARNAAMAGANVQQQAAGQAATLRAQEQLGAMSQAGGLATSQANQAANAVNSQQNALQGNLSASQNMQTGMNNTNAQYTAINAQGNQAMAGGLMSAAGSGLAMLSDANLKENVKPASEKTKEFLDKTGSHEYTYKDPSAPGAGSGKHVSPMAQELEQSELGKQMVMDTPQGKMVDYGKGMGTMLAAMSDIHKRLEAIEKPKKMADGGEVTELKEPTPAAKPTPNSFEGMGGATPGAKALNKGTTDFATGLMKGMQDMFGTGSTPTAAASPGASMGEAAAKPTSGPMTMMMAKGGNVGSKLKAGGHVPGKASVKGDSTKNDTVKALLSPEEIVLPRSVTLSEDPVKSAANFVAAIQAKKRKTLG